MFINILLNSQEQPPKSHPFPEPSPTGNGVSIAGQALQGSEVKISINGRLVGNRGWGTSLSPNEDEDRFTAEKSFQSFTNRTRACLVGCPTCMYAVRLFWGNRFVEIHKY